MKKLIILLVLFFNLNILAFEDDHVTRTLPIRTGWFAEVGGGYAKQNITYFNNSQAQRVNIYSGAATTLKVGLFLDEELALFYSNYTSYFSAPYIKNFTVNDTYYLDALNGVGVAYYFAEGKSFFISGSVGVGTFMTVGESNADFGSAYLLSIGYEFDNSFNVEFVLKKLGKVTSFQNDVLSIDAQSSQILLGYTIY